MWLLLIFILNVDTQEAKPYPPFPYHDEAECNKAGTTNTERLQKRYPEFDIHYECVRLW